MINIPSRPIEAELENGVKILVTPSFQFGETNVSTKFNLDEVFSTIEALATQIQSRIQNLSLEKINVEFGLEIGIQSGVLVSAIASGNAKSTLKIMMEIKK